MKRVSDGPVADVPRGRGRLRQADVQSGFLKSFGRLYPQFKFRGIRHFTAHSRDPFQLALRVAFGNPEIELDMLCVVLTTGDPAVVARTLAHVDPGSDMLKGIGVAVLIAPRFDREARALCRDEGVGYLDLEGNIGIQNERVYIEISVDREETVAKKPVPTPFEGKSERVVRRLLLEPGTVWHMRDLAQAAGVSLGLASMATSTLSEMGMLIKGRGGLSVMDADMLLDAWSEKYDLKRSPFQTWRSDKDADLLQVELGSLSLEPEEKYALTLWSGVQRLLPFDAAMPHLAVYWSGDQRSLAERLRLSSSRGRTVVFVFTPYDDGVFWDARRYRDGATVAHPLQLYLDLASGDESEVSLAQRVRERFLSR
jgi:hypothetical protein